MPSASQLYASGRWLNASDLANNPSIGLGKRIPATIHHVEPQLIGQGNDQETKLMLDLVSRQGQAWPKKLPLNKTNNMAMVAAFGDDYSFWPGKQIEVWAENVMFSGKLMPGIRIAPAPNGTSSQSPLQQQPQPQQQQAQPPAPPPSATAVTGLPPAAAPTWRQPQTAIEDDEIPF